MKNLNELRRRISEETVMDVIYDTFNIPTSLAAPEIRRSKMKKESNGFNNRQPKTWKILKNYTKCK